MGIFNKPRTVRQVADEYPNQSQYLMLVLYENWMSMAFPNHVPGTPFVGEDEVNAIYIGQALNYLFAKFPDLKKEPADRKEKIKEVWRVLPEETHDFMMQSKDIRRIIVYNLRMMWAIESSLKGIEWNDTPVGKHVNNLLSKYGGEFPEEVNDKQWHKLLNSVARTEAMRNSRKK